MAFAKSKNLKALRALKTKSAPALKPYDQRVQTHALSLVVTIVNRNQDDFFTDNYEACGAALSVVLYAYSKPPASILEYLGVGETKKDIILTVGRSAFVPAMLAKASERFRLSPQAKGIAFALPVTGVAGIAVYKFLADHNREERAMAQEAGK